MTKYHDSGTECRATKRPCPLGVSENDHIIANSPEEFQIKLEEKMGRRFGSSNTLVAEVSQESAGAGVVDGQVSEAVSPPIAVEPSNWVSPEILSYWNGSSDVFETPWGRHDVRDFEHPSTVTIGEFAQRAGVPEGEVLEMFGVVSKDWSSDRTLGSYNIDMFDVAQAAR